MVNPIKAAVLIHVDGSIEIYPPENGSQFSYEEARDLVGGPTERLSLHNRDAILMSRTFEMYLLVDADGLSKNLEFNWTASQLSTLPIYGKALWMPRELGW